MVDRIDIRGLGLKDLEKKFRKLEFKESRKIVSDAINKGADPVLETAKALVPVRTGRLRDGLRKRRSTTRKRIATFIQTPTRKKLGINPNASGYYPAVLEYGAPSRNLPARPYLRPALQQRRSQAITIIQRRIRIGVLRAVK